MSFVYRYEFQINSASINSRINSISGSIGGTTGSFTGSFTGSVLGTASYANQALSASYALSASFAPSTPPFPYTGSALITGSLGVTGSVEIIGTVSMSFSTGGKVFIAGAVGAGETLLEIRRTTSLSGGFIFRSDNGLNQVLNTTNGAFNIGTVDNSNITFTPGTGAIILNTVPGNMTAFNTAFQVRLGGGGGVGGRWLNYGWNASYGSILQAVQNASTPAVAPLSLNPFGSNVGVGAILPTAKLHVKGESDSVGSSFIAQNLSNTSNLILDNNGILRFNALGGSSNSTAFVINTSGAGAYVFRTVAGGYRILNFNLGEGVGDINGIASTAATNIGFYSQEIYLGKTSTNVTNQLTLGYDIGGVDNTYTKNNNLATNLFTIRGIYNISSGTGAVVYFNLTPTINQTGGASGRIVGYDYNPTLTSILGAHYGILVRPNTLNGFGLGNTLPSASLHIRGGLTGSILRLENNISSSIFVIENNGSGSYNGTLTVGNITSTPSTENTLNVYPPFSGGTGEGGQILFAASGGLYTSASMIDNYQNQLRILKGTNAGGSTTGYFTMNLDNGASQFLGPVTASAYSGLPNDYLYVTRNTDQTIGSGTWANQDIIFNNIVITKGISYNIGTGLASLTGGKVYRITARLAWSAAAVYLLQYSCYDSSDTQIGPTIEIVQPTNTSNNISDGTLEFIYAPVSNIDIKIRTTNNTTALTGEKIRGDLNTQLIIQQIA
jgi:hypothetical protein